MQKQLLDLRYHTLENNFDSSPKQSWHEKLGGIVSEEEDKEFQALGDRLLHTIAELDEEDRQFRLKS